MTRTKWIWVLSVLAALAAGGYIGARWWGSEPAAPPSAQPPAAPPKAEPPDAPFLQIEGTTLAGTDPQGRRVWDLRAKTLEVDRSKQKIMMTGVTGQFYSDGKPQLAFTAPVAVFDVTSKDVELSGGVLAKAPDGRTLRAARVRYGAAQRILAASGDVVLTQPGMSIRADELRTDAGLLEPKFSGNIIVHVSE